MSVGDKIREQRIREGKTMEELAQAIATTKQTIFKYESGIVTNIPLDKLEKIAHALNTTPAELMGWHEKKPATNFGDGLTEQDVRFCQLLRDLHPENRAFLEAQIDFLLKRQQGQE